MENMGGAENISSYLFNRAINRLTKLKEQLQQEIGRNIHKKIISLSYFRQYDIVTSEYQAHGQYC